MLVQMSKTKAPKQDKKEKKIILVTGATSGIGRLLVERLLSNKYEVRIILRKHPNENPEWKALPGGAKVYVTDIKSTDEQSRKVMMEACKGASAVFHLAAATRNYKDIYGGKERVDTNLMINTNVIGTENLLQAYADSNPNQDLHFIYSSSVTVYGYKRTGEMLTEESEVAPKSAYSESKYMAEQVIKAFAMAQRRLTYTILRIGVIYGEGYEESFMKIFKLINEKKLRLVNGGKNHLTLIDTDDVVEGMLRAFESSKSANKIYILTDGVPYTQKDLFEKAAGFLKVEKPTKSIHSILARIGARTRGIDEEQFNFLVSDRIVSIDKAKKEIGFRPHVSIDVEGKRLAKEFMQKYERDM
jgi:nucleoside-diphosphate-sugar epimerase